VVEVFGCIKLTLCSVKQFRDRFKKWGLNTKNIKRQVKDRVLAKINAGEVGVSNTIVWDNGTPIPVHKLQRHQAEQLRECRMIRTTSQTTWRGKSREDADVPIDRPECRAVAVHGEWDSAEARD